jgi:hypothetical protein
VAVVAAVIVLAFVVSRACQEAEIKLTQEEAVALATEQVDFVPENTQVRLLRQGIDREPFWIVSLSTLSANGEKYDDLVVVRMNATSGEIVELRDQSVKAGEPQATGDPEEVP